MNRVSQRVSAAVAAAALVAAVVTDLVFPAVEAWWSEHSLTGAVVAGVLVLAVTVLIVDEVTASRQLRDRARVAAVQAVIVFGQVKRTGEALLAVTDPAENNDTDEEVRSLSTMLLIAAPALFDDPVAQVFMEQAQRFSATLLRVGQRRSAHGVSAVDRQLLSDQSAAMQAALGPLLARLKPEEATVLGE